MLKFFNSTKRRCTWVSILVIAISGLVFETSVILKDFWNNPVLTQVTLNYTRYVQLPDMTFCSHQRLNTTAMRKDNITENLITVAMKAFTHSEWNEVIGKDQTPSQNQELLKDHVLHMKQLLVARGFRDYRQFLIHYRLDCNQFMLHCDYMGQDFDCCEAVVAEAHNLYGVCYIWKNEDSTMQKYMGVEHGFHALINAEPLLEGNGLGKWNPIDQGIFMEMTATIKDTTFDPIMVEPNKTTQIRLVSEQQRNRFGCIEAEHPYWTTRWLFTDCLSRAHERVYNCTLIGHTQHDAKEFCVPFIRETFYDATESELYEACVKSYLNPLCVVDSYRMTITNMNLDVGTVLAYNTSIVEGKRSLSRLRVFFPDLSYVVYQDQNKYSIHTFISAIGGQIGIWVGVSLLSLYHMIIKIYDWLKQTIKGKGSQEDDESMRLGVIMKKKIHQQVETIKKRQLGRSLTNLF